MLVGNHVQLRAQVRTLLAREGWCEVIGDIENGLEAISEARKLEPDMILVDVLLPDTNGLTFTSAVRRLLPTVQVVVLMYSTAYRRSVLAQGVSEIVLKTDLSRQLVPALKRVWSQAVLNREE